MFAAEVYDSLVESPAWDKHKPHMHATHLAVPRSHDKKEPTQLSPVKKRVKEGTPPTGNHTIAILHQRTFVLSSKLLIMVITFSIG